MYQNATKVKVLSPEITNIEEADSVHKLEGSMSCTAMAVLLSPSIWMKDAIILRLVRPWRALVVFPHNNKEGNSPF